MESSHNTPHSPVAADKPEVSSPHHNQPNWENRTIFTVIMLVLCFPIGALLALFWTNWRKSVKFLFILPLLIVPILIVLAAVIVSINPAKQIRMARLVAFEKRFIEVCKESNESTLQAQCNEIAKTYVMYFDNPDNSAELESVMNAKGDDFNKAVNSLHDKLVKEAETNGAK